MWLQVRGHDKTKQNLPQTPESWKEKLLLCHLNPLPTICDVFCLNKHQSRALKCGLMRVWRETEVSKRHDQAKPRQPLMRAAAWETGLSRCQVITCFCVCGRTRLHPVWVVAVEVCLGARFLQHLWSSSQLAFCWQLRPDGHKINIFDEHHTHRLSGL